MSKFISLTPELKRDILDEISSYLDKEGRIVADGKLSFTKSLGEVDRTCKLKFTALAYLKMLTLVGGCSKEIAWHGVAKRDGDDYRIEDIVVYPQEVDGTNVNTDQSKYDKWLMELDDDTYNNLRMQGHSHVNMSPTPSGVDLSHQERIITQLTDDMFYIFLIWNKKNDKNIKIYDYAKNCLYETKDVTVEVEGLGDFEKTAFDNVVEKKHTYNQYSSYGDYYKGSNTSASTQKVISILDDDTDKNKKGKKGKDISKGKSIPLKYDKKKGSGTKKNPRKAK